MERAAREDAGRIIRSEVGDDGVAVLTLDDASASVNTISAEFGNELRELWPKLQADERVRAILVISGKEGSFVAGAKLEMIAEVKDAETATELARQAQAAFDEIANSSKPVVVAVHGAALGGGLELALACRYRIATDDRRTRLGLPETQLGLIPGAGGTQRLPRLIGIAKALDLILTGRQLDPQRARRIGLVDEVVPPELLAEVARKRAHELAEGKEPSVRRPKRKASPQSLAEKALERSPMGRKTIFRKARQQALAKSRGHYPAIPAAIDVVEIGMDKGMEAGLAAEAERFGKLAVTEVSRQLVHLFFAQTALKKEKGVADPAVEPRPVRHVGMVGAGLMGGGIAYVTAAIADIPVRFKEQNDQALGRGYAAVRQLLDERVRRKRIRAVDRDKVMARITGSTSYEGFAALDLVVEAVFEDLALKHEVLRQVEANTKDDCIFATNTSTLPIGSIAEASRRPEHVVGMHYFSPVHRMPLLEVVRGKQTADWVVATAVALGKAQGKTVIVVEDGPGFYTSRILAPFMMEATWMLVEGADIREVDEALVNWGFPVGPFTLIDEVGIDVGHKVSQIMIRSFGERMAAPSALEQVIADKRLGRKSKRGFYTYGGGKKKEVDKSIYRIVGQGERKSFSAEEIQARLVLRMCNEAALCLQEGIIHSPRDGDVGAVFGLGFPPFRGGPFRFMDALGAREMVDQLRSHEQRFGPRFTPAPRLVELAEKGGRFYS